MGKRTVSYVVKNKLCCSCGVCNGACGRNAISFTYGAEINTPVIDSAKCVECGVCYDVCPGKGLDLNTFAKKLFGDDKAIKQDSLAGYCKASYVGHSNDNEIRFHSASGGVVTQFLIWLLKNKLINGAVVVRYRKDNPLEPEPFIATTEQDILDSRGSKYLVLSYDLVVAHIKDFEGRLAVVGLPCQIQGLRLLAQKRKDISDKIFGYFAIYCSLTKTKHSMDYYMMRYQLNKDDIGRFSFRDDGCLGFMKVEDRIGNVIKKVKYEKYWHGTHSFFSNSRCSLCIDHFGELADVSFGDIHVEPYMQDTVGVSSVVTRNVKWDILLRKCAGDGNIVLEQIPLSEVIRSQPFARIFKKGKGVNAIFQLRRMTNKPTPNYGGSMPKVKPGIKDYLHEIVKASMRWAGHYRFLWTIVKLADK